MADADPVAAAEATAPTPAVLDPAALLVLLQLGDSASPTGAFSHSFGLETALEDGTVTDAAGVLAWIGAYVRQMAYGDGLATRLAWDLADRGADLAEVLDLDAVLHASLVARQPRDAGRHMGRRLARIVRTADLAPGDGLVAGYGAAVESGEAVGHPAVVLGLALHAAGVPRDTAVLAQLSTTASSLTQNAVRAVPLGQDAGQRVLAGLHPVVLDAVAHVARLDPDDLGATAPGLEIAQMRHETQHSRMFMS